MTKTKPTTTPRLAIPVTILSTPPGHVILQVNKCRVKLSKVQVEVLCRWPVDGRMFATGATCTALRKKGMVNEPTPEQRHYGNEVHYLSPTGQAVQEACNGLIIPPAPNKPRAERKTLTLPQKRSLIRLHTAQNLDRRYHTNYAVRELATPLGSRTPETGKWVVPENETEKRMWGVLVKHELAVAGLAGVSLNDEGCLQFSVKEPPEFVVTTTIAGALLANSELVQRGK